VQKNEETSSKRTVLERGDKKQLITVKGDSSEWQDIKEISANLPRRKGGGSEVAEKGSSAEWGSDGQVKVGDNARQANTPQGNEERK